MRQNGESKAKYSVSLSKSHITTVAAPALIQSSVTSPPSSSSPDGRGGWRERGIPARSRSTVSPVAIMLPSTPPCPSPTSAPRPPPLLPRPLASSSASASVPLGCYLHVRACRPPPLLQHALSTAAPPPCHAASLCPRSLPTRPHRLSVRLGLGSRGTTFICSFLFFLILVFSSLI